MPTLLRQAFSLCLAFFFLGGIAFPQPAQAGSPLPVSSNRISPSAALPATLSAGKEYTCGIRSDGTLACWGEEGASPLDDIPPGTFTQVSAGQEHACALREDGSLACWGYDYDGQATPPDGAFLQVSAGDYHTCAIQADGGVACWGDDSGGQLDGIPSGAFVEISAGGGHTCGIRDTGELACWGDDTDGQISNVPTGGFSRLSAGAYHTCAIHTDGALACWSADWIAPLIGEPPGGSFTQVASGFDHSCGLRADGTLACWGSNADGQAPRIALSPAGLPDAVLGQAYAQSIGASGGTPPLRLQPDLRQPAAGVGAERGRQPERRARQGWKVHLHGRGGGDEHALLRSAGGNGGVPPGYRGRDDLPAADRGARPLILPCEGLMVR